MKTVGISKKEVVDTDDICDFVTSTPLAFLSTSIRNSFNDTEKESYFQKIAYFLTLERLYLKKCSKWCWFKNSTCIRFKK